MPALKGFACVVMLLPLLACAAAKQEPQVVPTPSDEALTALLAGKVWVAESIHGTPVGDKSHASMIFTTGGKVNGLGGCNNYSGSYSLEKGIVTFPPMASTMRVCPPALQKLEDIFFHSLEEAHKVSFTDGLLLLTPEGGKPSVFTVHDPE